VKKLAAAIVLGAAGFAAGFFFHQYMLAPRNLVT